MVKTNKKGKKGGNKKSKVSEKDAAEELKELYATIVEKTDLTEEEVAEAHKEFKAEYPGGEISMEEFMDQSTVSYGKGNLSYLKKRLYSNNAGRQRILRQSHN